MQKLKRNINMGFRVTEQEQQWIKQKMEQANISSVRAYLLKMAVDGMVVNLDLTTVNECSRLLSNIANNINQIAKVANTAGTVHHTDLATIQTALKQVWEQQDKILTKLAAIMEVV